MLHASRMHVALQERIFVSLLMTNIKQMIVEHAFSECRNSSNIMVRSSLLHQHLDIMLTLDGRTPSTHSLVHERICLQKFCPMHVNLQTIQHYLLAGERVLLLDIFQKMFMLSSWSCFTCSRALLSHTNVHKRMFMSRFCHTSIKLRTIQR